MAAAASLSAGLSARDESYIAFFNSVVAGNAEAALSALHVHLSPRYERWDEIFLPALNGC